MAKPTDADESLKRLGGGRWETRDARFTIEPQSGTWVVVDAEQTDDLGLPLVRGPFGSLTAAKEAIATARSAAPAASPLTDRAARLRDQPRAKTPEDADRPHRRSTATPRSATGAKTPTAEPSAEPKWIRDLEPAERRRAKRLIDRLTEAGAADPDGLARRDLVGEVPAVAGFAITRALTNLGNDATPARVAKLLAGGRDEDLGVRWRLVDGDDRPITLDLDRLEPR